ncbi:DUF2523 domain-containing protein [Photobacterium toruni]|uniref:DUF2523 domain-containing protein n=1 Tax=Photobacterium toruni TaxID=1935446 RepID=UPI00210FFBEB|nr:DUF2523 domain-containing protein [Photobacterium toruni]
MSRVFAFLFMSILPVFPMLLKSVVSSGAVALGVGTVLYTGLDFAMDTFISNINSNVNSLPVNVIQMFKLMGVSDMLNIYFSGAIALLTYKGMRAGSMRKQVWRKPGNKGDVDFEA